EELPQKQRVEHRVELLDLGCKLLDRSAPEGPADHRCALEHGLLLRRETVDAGSDQRLEGVRYPLGELGERPPFAFGKHPHRLLDEERVSLGLFQQGLESVGVEGSVRRKRLDQLLALLWPQRLELDRRDRKSTRLN